jgi:hypothetical protein
MPTASTVDLTTGWFSNNSQCSFLTCLQKKVEEWPKVLTKDQHHDYYLVSEPALCEN